MIRTLTAAALLSALAAVPVGAQETGKTQDDIGGIYEGKDERDRYPEGSDPIVLGEACNTAQTYGYDMVTQMQETKSTLCRIERA